MTGICGVSLGIIEDSRGSFVAVGVALSHWVSISFNTRRYRLYNLVPLPEYNESIERDTQTLGDAQSCMKTFALVMALIDIDPSH
jgi:hypothetical protein